MVGWITDATCIALTSQGMFAFSNKQAKNPDSVYAEDDFLQGKDQNLKELFFCIALVITAIFTKPVERVMRMGFKNKQRFVE